MMKSSLQRPLIFPSSSHSRTKLFAYYNVHWEQKYLQEINQMSLHINSCLYFQEDEDRIDWNETRKDGCGYVITYPADQSVSDPPPIYRFDRPKHFHLTSDEIYPYSKRMTLLLEVL